MTSRILAETYAACMTVARKCCFVIAAGLALISHSGLMGQESERVECDLYFQPESMQKFEVGDRITLVVNVSKPDKIMALGIAVDLEIISVKLHDDHYHYRIKALPKQKEKIDRAKKVSKLWFAGCKFRESHIETLEGDNGFEKFVKDNNGYRACDERDWGYGDVGPRAHPPDFLVKKK